MQRFRFKRNLADLPEHYLAELLIGHVPNGDSSFKVFVDSIVEFFPNDTFIIGDKNNLVGSTDKATVFYPYSPFITILTPDGSEDAALKDLRQQLLIHYFKQRFAGEPERGLSTISLMESKQDKPSSFYQTPHIGFIASSVILAEAVLDRVTFTKKTLLSERLSESAKLELATRDDIAKSLFFWGQDTQKLSLTPEVVL